MNNNDSPYLINKDNVKLLDCTLRDGGYYNNWEFSDNFVANYINQCQKIGIDIVELGYIRIVEKNYGIYGNLNKEKLKTLTSMIKFNKMSATVMLDAQEILGIEPNSILENIERIYDKNIVKYIRIAIHYSSLEAFIKYLDIFQKEKFNVCINLMQIDLATDKEIELCISIIEHLSRISAIYLADSLGSFLPGKLQEMVKLFNERISFPIGFHAHNNQGLALVNSLCAIKNGATWIDCTMYGMGRGAGNVQTEQILSVLKDSISNSVLNELYEFIITDLQAMKDKYLWGSSPLYGISGIQKIHPYYVQIPEKNGLSKKQIFNILKRLSLKNAQKFCNNLLTEVVNYEN